MLISSVFVVDPPLVKQSAHGDPTVKGVTEAAVWDAWVSHRLHLLFVVLFSLYNSSAAVFLIRSLEPCI